MKVPKRVAWVLGILGLVVCAELVREYTAPKRAVPEFSIAVKLSESAQKKLQGMHESVLVIAYFDGDPLPGKREDNSPMRGVVLGSDKKLVDPNNVATFADTKISQSHWDDLADKDYYVTINVVSARKTSNDDLLDCDDPMDRISRFVGKSTQVLCRLIGERDALSN